MPPALFDPRLALRSNDTWGTQGWRRRGGTASSSSTTSPTWWRASAISSGSTTASWAPRAPARASASARRNEELRAANAALAQASELKSSFIQVASHELRTPITILLALTYLVKRAPSVPEPLNSWLRGIVNATDRLHHLVDQLTTMLSLERFERPLVRRPASLSALLQEAASDVRPFVDLRGQTLVCDFDDTLGTIDGEAPKVRDALNHLLLNAIKFTPDAGRITLRARRTPEQGAEIEVVDSGAGIDAASLPRIFEPFLTAFDLPRLDSG